MKFPRNWYGLYREAFKMVRVRIALRKWSSSRSSRG